LRSIAFSAAYPVRKKNYDQPRSSQAQRHMTASSSVLHGWDDKGNPIPFTLNVLNINSLADRFRTETRLDRAGLSHRCKRSRAIVCNQQITGKIRIIEMCRVSIQGVQRKSAPPFSSEAFDNF